MKRARGAKKSGAGTKAGPRVSRELVFRGGEPGRAPGSARPLPFSRVQPTPGDPHSVTVPTDFLRRATLFVRGMEPPREWIDELRRHSPKHEEHGWLYVHFEVGDPWVPGQRWTLYEMLHEKFVDTEVLKELTGPHPRSEGHMCSNKVPQQFQCLCRRKLETWRGGPCALITLTQYQIFKKTGYFARPFWIIQGEKGGHKFSFNEREKEIARLADLPGDPPAMGDLAYAPFDQRVVHHIIRNNRLRQFGVTLGEFKDVMGNDEKYARHRQRLARNLRAEYVSWFAEQLTDVGELFVSAARKGQMDDQRKTSIDFERVEDHATHHFIESGEMLAPHEIQ